MDIIKQFPLQKLAEKTLRVFIKIRLVDTYFLLQKEVLLFIKNLTNN